tara:strand:- start:36885 stop:37946 length:1062 start_codon:yes stop_codon:yes gene_type:complete
MKKLLLLLTLFSISYSFATIKTTVADGDWFDANNWNPAGVPVNEDTVIINHIVSATDLIGLNTNWLIISTNAEIISDTTFTLNGNYKGFGNMTAEYFITGGDSSLVYGEVNGDHFGAGSTYNINFGSILADTLTANLSFENNGLIDVNIISTGGSNFINKSNAAINVSNLITLGSTISSNEVGATIVCSEFVTNGDFTNDGDVSCSNWTHGAGTVTGTTGRFCVNMCFVNNATINGTVDICDASPGSICDIDMGTIAGTVTNCANGACGNNVGIEEEQLSLSIYPNPASDKLFIDGFSSNAELKIFSITGQVVKSENIINENLPIDISSLKRGTYLVQVVEGTQSEILKLIVK